jgi:hypothetical protein
MVVVVVVVVVMMMMMMMMMMQAPKYVYKCSLSVLRCPRLFKPRLTRIILL